MQACMHARIHRIIARPDGSDIQTSAGAESVFYGGGGGGAGPGGFIVGASGCRQEMYSNIPAAIG